VSSDVVIPDVLEKSKLREKDDPDALAWDEIQKSPYNTWKAPYDINAVSKNSQQRVDANPAFNLIKTNTEWLEEQNDKSYSLNLEKYRENKKKISSTVKQFETLNKLSREIDVEDVPGAEERFGSDKDKLERYKNWKKSLKNDIYLDEALNAVNDMVYQKNLAYSKAGEQKVVVEPKQ